MLMQTTRPRPNLAYGLAIVVVCVCVALTVATEPGFTPGAAALFAVVIAAGELASSRLAVTIYTSAAGVAMYVVAAGYGPLTALVAAGVGQVLGWVVDRYRVTGLATNVAAFVAPAMVAGFVTHALPHDSTWEIAAGAVVGTAAGEVTNLAVGGVLISLIDAVPLRSLVRSVIQLATSFVIEAAFVAVITVADARSHVQAAVLVTLMMVVYVYMSRLVTRAYEQSAIAAERAHRYATLSLGVLSSLVSTLGARDPRAARHCAAVARYARDLAESIGLDEREQEIAHTAGLLHDIGRFTLSDRVLDGGETLTDEDWEQIFDHPARGAELVRDLDAYGPIAQIVAAHHEQVAGTGYPEGLKGDEIPLLSRVIAVCEVYDTLTAHDTYRAPPLSSFEALNELRRVAGVQLDGELVESFAAMLAGTGTDYRHASAADFDAELEVQRTMTERLGPPAGLR
jgi:putative nucleotidyltransferase with HDIG domain